MEDQAELEAGRWYECKTGRIENVGGVNVMRFDRRQTRAKTYYRTPDDIVSEPWLYDGGSGRYVQMCTGMALLIESEESVGAAIGLDAEDEIEYGLHDEIDYLRGHVVGR